MVDIKKKGRVTYESRIVTASIGLRLGTIEEIERLAAIEGETFSTFARSLVESGLAVKNGGLAIVPVMGAEVTAADILGGRTDG